MTAVKAHIYAEDGSLLGFIAYNDTPPEILELSGRYFKHHGVSKEDPDEDDCNVICFDYWEIDVVEDLDVIQICIGCGRNASLTWWKCCPEHMELESPDVFCQSCVERAHPGDPEFFRD